MEFVLQSAFSSIIIAMNKPRHHIVIDARIRRSSTGRYVDRLLEHLQNIDSYHRYTVLVQPDDPWEPKASNFHAIPCRYAQFSLNPLDQFAFAWQLYRLKPDMVHFSMSQQPLPYFGNIVTTSHDTTMYYFVRRGSTPLLFYKFKIWLYRFLVWQAHVKSKKIIVPTKTVAKEFQKLQPWTAKKMVVTLESSEPPLPMPAEHPVKVPANAKFIMYVGTAFPHKNLSGLIKGFEILHQTHPDLTLVIAGKIEKHYDELMAWAAQRDIHKHIIFTGFVSDAELKWLYQHCQAYVFASLSEGFGLPPLEAMAHKAPVVSSNASCMPEVYEAAAHYFNPRSPKDLAQKVAEVIDNPALKKELIAKGQQQLKKYSWERMAQETLIVYKEALGEETDI